MDKAGLNPQLSGWHVLRVIFLLREGLALHHLLSLQLTPPGGQLARGKDVRCRGKVFSLQLSQAQALAPGAEPARQLTARQSRLSAEGCFRFP